MSEAQRVNEDLDIVRESRNESDSSNGEIRELIDDLDDEYTEEELEEMQKKANLEAKKKEDERKYAAAKALHDQMKAYEHDLEMSLKCKQGRCPEQHPELDAAFSASFAKGLKLAEEKRQPIVTAQYIFIPDALPGGLFNKLKKEMTFEQVILSLHGQLVNEARLSVYYSDEIDEYRYSGVTRKAYKLTPELKKIREMVEDILTKCNHIAVSLKPVKFSGVLANLYETGNNYINYHADKEQSIIPNSPIASVSIGATRKFRFRKIGETSGFETEIELRDGDLLVMQNNCQKVYKHGIVKEPKVLEPRINLTFRQVR